MVSKMTKRITLSLFIPLFLSLFLFASPAMAENFDEGGLQYLAVQKRLRTPTHEFTGWIGSLPLDAFIKGLTGSAAYTLHFDDLWAWEIANVTYSYGLETDLKAELESLPLPLGPTPFETVDYFVTSNLVVKPVYGKFAILNDSILHGELLLIAGGGYGWMTVTSRPVVDVGFALRVYAGEMLSLRLDVRDYAFVNIDDIHNEIWVALGASIAVN